MSNKVPVKEKIGYACGEFGGSLVWQVLMKFQSIFYTDIFGLSTRATQKLFLIVRIFDAINDPIMGAIADRTNTKWGKFRPYILWMCLPYALFGTLMFITPSFGIEGKTIYAYITYTAMMIIYTAMMIPYCSLTGVMTSDHKERTSLTSYRFVGAYAGTLAVVGLLRPLVKKFGGGNEQIGFAMTMGFFSLICLGLFMVAFFFVRERVRPSKKQITSLKQDISDLMHNVPWITLFLISFISLVYIVLRGSNEPYYFKYYIEQKSLEFSLFGWVFHPDLLTLFMTSGTIMVLLGVFPAKWLGKTFGKRNAYLGCMSIIAIALVLHYFVNPRNLKLLFILHWTYSFASGPTMPLVWSMYADTADYSEWKTGRRATGLVFSASTFAYKFGAAIGGAGLMEILTRYGYKENVEQTAQSLMGIRISLSIVPAAIAAIAVILLLFYRLDTKKLDRIQDDLQKRRELEGASAEMDASAGTPMGESDDI